jgi:hypothetical protein
MEQMAPKRNPLLWGLLLALILLAAGLVTYSFLLPRYIEKKILPDLGRTLSASLTGRVYDIGLSSADVGEIDLGAPGNSGVSIATIHAEYSLSSLLAKKLDRLTINGLVLHLEVSDGRITVPGLYPPKVPANKGGQNISREPSGLSLPVEPTFFQVSDSLVAVNYEGEHFLLPFDLQLQQKNTGENNSVYNFTLQMMPEGETVTLDGALDLTGNIITLKLVADSLDVHRFVSRAGTGNNLDFGKVAVKGEAALHMLPLQLVSVNLAIDPDVLHLGKTAVRFGHGGAGSGPAIKLDVQSDRKRLLVTMQGSVTEPLAATLALNGSVVTGNDTVQGSGNFAVRLTEPLEGKKGEGASLVLKSLPELHTDFDFSRHKSGTWKAEIIGTDQKQQGRDSRGLHLQYENMSLRTEVPSVVLRGQGNSDAGEIQASLDFPGMQANYAGTGITLASASLHATYRQETDAGNGPTSGSSFDLTLDGVELKEKGLVGKADIALQGAVSPRLMSGEKVLQAEGKIRLVNAEITERGSTVALGGIEGTIPWAWPQTGKVMAGGVKVPRMQWKDIDLGSFKGDITFKDMIYSLEGKYTSSLFKGVVAKVSGRAGLAGSAYFGELALQSGMTSFAPINLGKFDRGLDKSYFSGELGIDTLLKFGESGLQGKMQVNLHKGIFEIPEKKYTVKGIDLSMLLPELPNLRTAPAQTLNFTEASIGNLTFSQGKLVWQLESTTSIFLEEGVVQWAGGRVFTNSVRLSPEMKEVVVPIFCDRLKLTELLHQFGMNDAAGEGTVNGRIPLRIGRDTIGFEDGFLYSSPGQGGSIKIAALDLLSTGIPKNSPQFGQVDFAAEALKNFRYNWVKLLLDTEGEDLIMQMQMDGRPVQSLPFSYDSKTGVLHRTDNTEQGIDQPIRLDVNFRLPLNRFLGYSGKIQDLIKKIK